MAECHEPWCREREWNLRQTRTEGSAIMTLCHTSRLWLPVFVMLPLCGHFKGQPSRRGSIIFTLHHFDTLSSFAVYFPVFQCVPNAIKDASVFNFTVQEHQYEELQLTLISILFLYFASQFFSLPSCCSVAQVNIPANKLFRRALRLRSR